MVQPPLKRGITNRRAGSAPGRPVLWGETNSEEMLALLVYKIGHDESWA